MAVHKVRWSTERVAMDLVNVVSIPAGHVYPQALRSGAGWSDIKVLADPVIDPAEPGRWWPHPALEKAWWEQQPRRIDVCHLHFGFEHLTEEQTREFVAVLEQQRVPLVLTVHDLDNPHLADQRAYHRQLHLLVAAATTVLTLSDRAAGIIGHRCGKTATVVPHPPVVPADHQPPAPGTGVGVFLKSLRANVVAKPAFFRQLAARVPLTVYLHRDREHTALARNLGRLDLGGLDLKIHDPMADQTLFNAVGAHEVVVLPYLRGTHSGWLEMCLDLGVKVAVPDCGCYHSQANQPSAVAQYAVGNGADAARVARDLLRRGRPPQRQRDTDNSLFHSQLYRDLKNGRHT